MDSLEVTFVLDLVAGLTVSVFLLLLLKVFSPGPLADAPARQGRISLLSAFGVIALYIGLEIAALEMLIFLGVSGSAGPRTLAETVMFQGADAGVKLVVCVFIVWLMRGAMAGGIRGWGLGPGDVWRGVKYGVVAIVVTYPLLLLANAGVEELLEHFGRQVVEHETFDLLKEHPAGWQTALLLLAAAVVAPIAEEMFFRGILQTALVQRGWGLWWPMPRLRIWGFELAGLEYPRNIEEPVVVHRPGPAQCWAAIVITAAIFAAIHVSPTNFPVLFLLGIALGYVYERTGILWALITLHALFNVTNLTGFFLNGGT